MWFKKNNYGGLFIFEEMKNNLMTKAEEIRLHNLFIKFKNEGKELDEIKGLLEVDTKLLKKWDKKFDTQTIIIAEQKIPVKTIIVGTDEKDNYQYNSTFSFQMLQLDYIKFTLNNIIGSIEENIEPTTLQLNAKKYLPIFIKYFESINLKIDIDGEANVEFKLNTDDKNVKLQADEAIKFYSLYVFYIEGLDESYLIQSASLDIYNNAQKILPYCLKTIKVKYFDGIKETGFRELPIDTNWIFLIGENGYGKTSILRAIAVGFIGEKDEEAELFKPNFQSGIGTEYFSLSISNINNVGQGKFKSFPHLACYGPSRLQIQTEQTQNDVAKKSTTTYSLFNADGVLLNIEFELLIWFLEKNPRFDSVKQTFLKLIPYLSDIQVDVPKRKVFYIEKEPTENGVKYNPVTFNELASGFRSILAMVGDMMIRLFKSQSDITEPSELAGIVIIDEIDLHWHPKMQREIPVLLSSIFPKVQFIASTHSLVPLLGAPENSVLLKVNRTVEEGITVEKMEINFQALSSDTMLRDIFDLEKYQSDAKLKAWERYKELKRLMREETDMDLKENYMDERREIGNKYNFPA